MKVSKRTIKLLAARWVKDERTIRRWLKDGHPMLEHPESVKILNEIWKDKKPVEI